MEINFLELIVDEKYRDWQWVLGYIKLRIRSLYNIRYAFLLKSIYIYITLPITVHIDDTEYKSKNLHSLVHRAREI